MLSFQQDGRQSVKKESKNVRSKNRRLSPTLYRVTDGRVKRSLSQSHLIRTQIACSCRTPQLTLSLLCRSHNKHADSAWLHYSNKLPVANPTAHGSNTQRTFVLFTPEHCLRTTVHSPALEAISVFFLTCYLARCQLLW
jgi:hypothetical protein